MNTQPTGGENNHPPSNSMVHWPLHGAGTGFWWCTRRNCDARCGHAPLVLPLQAPRRACQDYAGDLPRGHVHGPGGCRGGGGGLHFPGAGPGPFHTMFGQRLTLKLTLPSPNADEPSRPEGVLHGVFGVM